MASDHGHVYPSTLRARCGGPTMCRVCFADLTHSLAVGDGAGRRFLDELERKGASVDVAELERRLGPPETMVRLPELTIEEANLLLGALNTDESQSDGRPIVHSLRTAIAEAITTAERETQT